MGNFQIMPAPYSRDLRWRVIWMKEVLGYEVNEEDASLSSSPRTVERYRRQFLTFGDINPEVIGRPLNSVSMHPYAEFLIMEAVLKHPEKTLAKNSAWSVCPNRKSVYFGWRFLLTWGETVSVGTRSYFSERNSVSFPNRIFSLRKAGCFMSCTWEVPGWRGFMLMRCALWFA